MRLTKDLIIIGAGPGGMSSAMYAGRAQMDVLVIEREGLAGGQMLNTSEIDNYLGSSSTNPFELADEMFSQANRFDNVEFLFNTTVAKVHKSNKHDLSSGLYVVDTGDGKQYLTKSVIIASGTKHRELSVNGEGYNHDNTNNVSYCATCDFPFYKDKRVAVIGGGDSAFEAAQLLSEVADSVDLIHYRDTFKAKPGLQEQIYRNNKIKIITGHEFKNANISNGSIKYVSLKIKGQDGTRYHAPREYDGVFPNIGIIPNSTFLMSATNEEGFITVLHDLRVYSDYHQYCNEDMSGIWAIGDVTDNKHRQVSIAAGQGAQAALSAYEYVKENNMI